MTEQEFRDKTLEAMRNFGRENDKSFQIVANELIALRQEIEELKKASKAAVKFLVSQQ